MKVSRRSIFGALLVLPFGRRATQFIPVKGLAPAKSRLTVNGAEFSGENLHHLVEQFDQRHRRFKHTASFKAPIGRFKPGEDISIAFNGQLIFSGVVRMVSTQFSLDPNECRDEIEAVDKLSLLPDTGINLTGLNDREAALRVGQELLNQMKSCPRFA